MVRKEETGTRQATAHTPKSIVIADDHPFVGDYLKGFCAERWPNANIHLHRSCTHVVEFARKAPIDLLIMDYAMPGLDALEAVDAVLESRPEVKIIVFSGVATARNAAEILAAGASAYVSKAAGVESLDKVVDLVMLGETYAPASIVTEMLDTVHLAETDRSVAEPEKSLLSDRERRILNGLVAGDSNKVIANDMGLSESSVKQLVRTIFRKLSVKNRAQAVAEALRLGLVDTACEA